MGKNGKFKVERCKGRMVVSLLGKCYLRVVCATLHRRTGHGDVQRFCHPVLGTKNKKQNKTIQNKDNTTISRVYHEPKEEPCSQGRARARGARGLLRGRCGARSQPRDSRLRGRVRQGPQRLQLPRGRRGGTLAGAAGDCRARGQGWLLPGPTPAPPD